MSSIWHGLELVTSLTSLYTCYIIESIILIVLQTLISFVHLFLTHASNLALNYTPQPCLTFRNNFDCFINQFLIVSFFIKKSMYALSDKIWLWLHKQKV